jgi:hypothetical protein
LYPLFLIGVLALLFSGCVAKGPQGKLKMISYEMVVAERVRRQEAEKENQKLKETLKKQIAARRELERRIATIQLRLIRDEIENKKPAERLALLEKRLDEAIQEVVRTKAKLRSMESKAEAASSLAEAEVALKDLKPGNPGLEEDPEITQADHLFEMSALEFKNQNYSGSLYLTSQAKRLIKMARERSVIRESSPAREEPVSFILPVRLRVLKTSNVREGPGLDFKVRFTLEKDSRVIGHSYKDQWVQVRSGDGREGWIFYSLVDAR